MIIYSILLEIHWILWRRWIFSKTKSRAYFKYTRKSRVYSTNMRSLVYRIDINIDPLYTFEFREKKADRSSWTATCYILTTTTLHEIASSSNCVCAQRILIPPSYRCRVTHHCSFLKMSELIASTSLVWIKKWFGQSHETVKLYFS